MKTSNFSNVPASIVTIFLMLMTASCAEKSETPDEPSGDVVAPTAAPPVLGVIPWFDLLEPSGLPFAFEELRGLFWIGGFVGSASGAEVTDSWLLLQNELKNHPSWPQTRLVSFSPSSTGDTPESLGQLARDLGADLLHWLFLTGSSEQLDMLIDRLGGDSSRLVLADRMGQIRGSYERSAKGISALVRDLDKLVAELRPLPYPDDIMNPSWLEARQRQQLQDAQSSTVRHDFKFADRRAESGISFRNRTTEDSGKRYKSNHYDHGNGVLTADVDGDGLMDLYFLSQLGSNELWRARGEGRFTNITESSGAALEDKLSISGAFGDIDNDGDPDLFVTTVRDGNVLLLNDGSGSFQDITETAGVGEVAHSSSAIFFDYDRDGLLDLFVSHVGRYTTDEKGPGDYWIGYQIAFDGHLKPERAERSTLFHNLGEGRFEDVSEALGLVETGWNGDASLIDLDADGWQDLFITDMQGHDDVYRNVEGKRFEPWPNELFPATPFGTMGIQVFDFNNDLRLDVFLTDMHTDMVRKFSPEEEASKLPAHQMMPLDKLGTDGNHVLGNALYLRQADGSFTEVSDAVGAENYWPWGLSAADLNADGWQDAFLTSSMSYGWRYGTNSLLLNEAGQRFQPSEFVLGVEPRVNHVNGIPWYELDCSDPEEEENFHCQDKEGVWQVWGALGSRSSVILDIDGDGDLDIVTNEFNAQPMVLVSDLAARGALSYLEIELQGTASNRDALGASVTLRAGDRAWRQVKDGNSGYLSFSPQPLYFGLAELEHVDSLEIVWPSGNQQKVDGPLEINRRMLIVEP